MLYDDAGCEGSVKTWLGQSRCTPLRNPLVPIGARSLAGVLDPSGDDDDRRGRLSDNDLRRRDVWASSDAAGTHDQPFRVGPHLPDTHGGELCIISSHRLCEEPIGTALLGASSPEMMQDFPLHV